MTSLLEVKLTWAAPLSQETNTRLQCMKRKVSYNNHYLNTDINGFPIEANGVDVRQILAQGAEIDNPILVRWLSAFKASDPKTVFKFYYYSETSTSEWGQFHPVQSIILEALDLLPVGSRYKSTSIQSIPSRSLVTSYLWFS